MLLPDPIERRDDFLARFMADAEMVAEYPSEDQRYAVALATWQQETARAQLAKALEHAHDTLAHGEYALLAGSVRELQIHSPRVFVSQTALSPVELDLIAKHYDASIPIVLDAAIPASARTIFALGRDTEAACKELRPDAIVHFLPHPASLLRSGAQPEKISKRLAQLLQSANVRVLDSGAGNRLESVIVAIRKAYEPKQIVYAVVLDPYQFDAHGDWIPPRHVEEAAHKFLRESRLIGRDHDHPADAQVVESWVERYPSEDDYRKAFDGKAHRAFELPFGADTVHSGAWVLGIKLGDSEWRAYRDGEIDALSIGASGYRTPASEASMPEVEFVKLGGSG